MAAKREDVSAKRNAHRPAASQADDPPLTDADLHDEIQNFEQSDEYIYGDSGYRNDDFDDAKVRFGCNIYRFECSVLLYGAFLTLIIASNFFSHPYSPT